MSAIELKIEHLMLDTDNPRITHADSQREALQKVVKDQRVKLVRLAQSIVDKGLSPIERLMVLQVSQKPRLYIPLEGNRRIATLTFLSNPDVMTGLDMPDSMRRIFQRLSGALDLKKIEPISCYEVESRDQGRYWIELRHNGENEGRGVVQWAPITAARWRKRDLGIQAFDLVIEHGGFSPEEAEKIKSGFPLTTLKRLMEVPDVRNMIGLTAKDGVLYTELPPAETIKALRRMVLDLANKAEKSRTLNRTGQMVEYVKGFNKADKPNLTKKVEPRPVEAIPKSEFAKIARARPQAKKASAEPAPRIYVVPKTCMLNVTDNRISEIYEELRTKLKLSESRNAISVLLRVFLEMSVDHFLENNGGSVSFKSPDGKTRFKKLDKKLLEVVDSLVGMGVPRNHFAAVIRSLTVPTNPMYVELFHMYVHERFATPSPGDLTAAWNNAQPLFEKIWP